MVGVAAQAPTNEFETGLYRQALQRSLPPDKRDGAFAAKRRTGERDEGCEQGKRKVKHTPFPTHLG
jgi:hypothetical protein